MSIEKHFYQVGNQVTYGMGAEMELSANHVTATVLALTWDDDSPSYTLKIEENGQVIRDVSHDGLVMQPNWWK